MKYGKFCLFAFANTITQNVRIVNPIFSSIDNENLLCDKLTVTGDDEYGCTGTYIISNENASFKIEIALKVFFFHSDAKFVGEEEHHIQIGLVEANLFIRADFIL